MVYELYLNKTGKIVYAQYMDTDTKSVVHMIYREKHRHTPTYKLQVCFYIHREKVRWKA